MNTIGKQQCNNSVTKAKVTDKPKVKYGVSLGGNVNDRGEVRTQIS